MSVEVRRASIDDIPWILEQLKNFSDFYGTRKSLFGDDEYSHAFISHLIENHLFYVADTVQFGPVGLIAGTIEPHIYNPSLICLTECFWWVDEKHRGSKAGLLLLNAFVQWGKNNCDWVWMTLESSSPVKDATLFKRGFKEQERSFLLEV